MAYSNRFVACVVVDGRVQKELANGTVKIPFGSEYTLRFRNKNNRRGVVQFFIDGENVSGDGYVIQPNSKIDIRRHATVDRAFKFVELDSEDAVEHGKDGPNQDKKKGLIEARFFLEKQSPPYIKTTHHHHHYPKPPFWPYPHWDGTYTTWCDSGVIGSSYTHTGGEVSSTFCSTNTGGVNLSSLDDLSINSMSASIPTKPGARKRSMLRSASVNAAQTISESVPTSDGCTVEGQATGQSFYTTSMELEDNFTTVKVFLQGYDPDLVEEVPVPVHVRGRSGLSRLEDENEKLRAKIAELENEKLKEKLSALQD